MQLTLKGKGINSTSLREEYLHKLFGVICVGDLTLLSHLFIYLFIQSINQSIISCISMDSFTVWIHSFIHQYGFIHKLYLFYTGLKSNMMLSILLFELFQPWPSGAPSGWGSCVPSACTILLIDQIWECRERWGGHLAQASWKGFHKGS